MDPMVAMFLPNAARREAREVRPDVPPQLALPDFGPTTIYDPSLPLVANHPKTFDCQICLDEELESTLVSPESCGHKFGRLCLHTYVTSRLGEGRYPIPCPSCFIGSDYGPDQILTRELVSNLGVSDDDLKLWDDLEIALTSVQLRCPECSEARIVNRARLAKKKFGNINCKSKGCSQSWCRKCFAPLTPKSRHVCDGDKALEELVKSNKWTRCPGCHIAVQKISGCEHITCTACQVHFCYTCGADIGKPERGDNVYGHFTNCPGRPGGLVRRGWFRWGRS